MMARCHLELPGDAQPQSASAPDPSALDPATIRAVYGFPAPPEPAPAFGSSNLPGAGKTIAIVDAYDSPAAESDLAVFSLQYGLPTCTTANGCFTKVDQYGGSNYPSINGAWALEISLDVQWAHAIAPGARILLVEAASSSLADLLTAEDYAKTHATYVSNSWGTSEFGAEQLYDGHFSQPGVSFFASAGDSGLPADWPSASPNVISVGGTTLAANSATGTWLDSTGLFIGSETGWSFGGGGCSQYERATTAQSAFRQYKQAKCGVKRATPDVALIADPASGVSVYDSTPYSGAQGWFKVGGTSVGAPMWAARSAVAGTVVNATFVYGSSIAYRDIVSGNNGAPCLVGYDLCTGRGSWTGGTP